MNKKYFILGGDIKKSLAEGYRFDFNVLFKDAFVITRKNFPSLIVASLFTIIVLVGLYTLMFNHLSSLGETQQMIVNYIITLLIAPPLLTGLSMMGVHHSIGLKTRSFDIFNYFNILLKLSLATIIISLMTNVSSVVLSKALGDAGILLSVLVLLYLNMVFSLVYPLIAEKKVTAQQALSLSFKLVHKNLLQFTLLFIFLGVLFIIALIPSGLGMIFFIPFYFNLMGIVYRQICGVGIVASETTKDGDDNLPPPPSSGFEA